MATPNDLATKLKSLHKPGAPIVFANVYDATTAAAVAALPSCRALATASFAIAQAAGLTDDDLDLATNLAGIRTVGRVARRHGLALTADLQDGYGEQLEDAIAQAIDAGAVGANIEDVDKGSQTLLAPGVAAERVERALRVAADKGVPDFVVNARCDALLKGGTLDEVIARGNLYLRAGATSVFVWGGGARPGISRDEVVKLSRAFEGRLNVSMMLPEGTGLGVDELAAIGVSRISVGPKLQGLAMQAYAREAEKFLKIAWATLFNWGGAQDIHAARIASASAHMASAGQRSPHDGAQSGITSMSSYEKSEYKNMQSPAARGSSGFAPEKDALLRIMDTRDSELEKLESTRPRTARRKPWLAVLLTSIIAVLLVVVIYRDSVILDTLQQLKDSLRSNAAVLDHRFSNGKLVKANHRSAVSTSDAAAAASSGYVLGVGKADITGPVVELNFMGYANGSQIGSGLRQRIYSRAFIVGDAANSADRFIYMVLDTQSGDTAVRNGILDGLKALGPAYAAYSQKNVAVTGTHSHSGPGAWLNYLLPQVTSLGFDKQSYQAIVDGALLSIKRAHESLAPGTLSFGSTRIEDANINRSLFAYLNNPASERVKYGDDTVDKTLTMLKFRRTSDAKDIGVLTWFPVHGTSMLGNNTIVTGDNKGVAAYLYEQSTKDPSFVAGFSQSNVGDTTPNVNGAYCEEGPALGQMCTLQNSTCDGKNEPCHGRGPLYGLNDAGTKSCFEIGRRQFQGASALAGNSKAFQPIAGPVRSLHTFKDLSNFTFTLPNGKAARTCSGALGYSFAAGTSDGPGAFDFTQGDEGAPNANPLWSVVSKLLHNPSKEQIACQQPKPILLDAGATKVPYDWAPNIVDIQLLRVGPLFIIVSPGEATTMSGRRWKAALAAKANSLSLLGTAHGDSQMTPLVVLGGPANSYTHYIATPEEYAIQRYEGASTLYGPHTLDAYISLTSSVLPYLAATPPNAPLAAGPTPQDNRNHSLSFITPVIFDAPGLLRSFGQVLTDVAPTVARGKVARATFVGANPRNNLRLEGTFAAVERKGADGTWSVVRDDRDWELVYRWTRTNSVAGTSEVSVTWEVPADAVDGQYRLRYYGDSKGIGGVKAFQGLSKVFSIA
ncbi:hypothetical protein FH972_025743 [Carpinus fangiana]|uniref:ceramidase n=1 Tax=Carpinus fangiana TaxID=176857 RepID=A0A5N6L2H3_9ROSI|nr:hypothetical protein FH972_025743 [Carpinus fangiana]